MKAGELKVTFDGMKKFQDAMKALAVTDVYVGIPQEVSDQRQDEEGEEFMNNATIGYINENGSDLAGIPPRPHLVPGIKKVEKEIAAEFKQAAQKAFSNPSAVLAHYNRAGIIAVNSVKKIITDQDGFTPLSETTLERRKEQGFKGDKALIRTGQYRNAITYTVGENVKGKK
jgi:hypothetical protein